MNDVFDVFLSHNSKNKPAVQELAAALRKRNLRVWLDEDELRPGIPWQTPLEDGIRASASIAVLIGKDGLGPWEDEEMQVALRLAIKDKRPVIPVILPGAPQPPELPLFLGNRPWVDLRPALSEAGLDRLEWGINGNKPKPPPSQGYRPRRRRYPLAITLLLPIVLLTTWWILHPKPCDLGTTLYYEGQGSTALPLGPGQTLTAKDGIRIAVEPDRDCYLYILWVDGDDQITWLFPPGPYRQPLHGARFMLPAEDKWYELDNTPGEERFLFSAGRTPSDDLEANRKRIDESRNLPVKARRELRAEVVKQLEQRRQSAGGLLLQRKFEHR